MPRTQRQIVKDETAVYHAWDVEPNLLCHIWVRMLGRQDLQD